MSCCFQGSHPNTELYIKLGEQPNITKTSTKKENEIKQYFKFLTIFLCMGGLPLCMPVCHLWTLYAQRPKEGARSSLTTEPSPQLQNHFS